MSEFQPFPGAALDRCGLNRHAVFDLADLPDDIVGSDTTDYRQLILIGHGGKALWEAVKKSGVGGADPIDDFTLRTIRQWMAEFQPDNRYAILYPGPQPVALQRLGALAGWHHASPFMVGIDAEWGTWYAYRAVVLADTHFAPSPAVDRIIPCAACQTGRASPPALRQPWPTAHFPCRNASPGASRPTRHAPSPVWRGSPARSAAITAIAPNNWPIPIRFRCRPSGNITE